MGETDHQEVLQYYLEDKENLEDFLEAANIIQIFPELDVDTLESAIEADDKAFIRSTVSGTMEHLVDIDNLINAQARNWSTLRMMSADKLAKLYGEDESFKFVNAILDAIAKKAARDE